MQFKLKPIDSFSEEQRELFPWNCFSVLVAIDDATGKEIILGNDGGEPEDQTLNRDYSWVLKAIQSAYNQGYKEGKEKL